MPIAIPMGNIYEKKQNLGSVNSISSVVVNSKNYAIKSGNEPKEIVVSLGGNETSTGVLFNSKSNRNSSTVYRPIGSDDVYFACTYLYEQIETFTKKFYLDVYDKDRKITSLDFENATIALIATKETYEFKTGGWFEIIEGTQIAEGEILQDIYQYGIGIPYPHTETKEGVTIEPGSSVSISTIVPSTREEITSAIISDVSIPKPTAEIGLSTITISATIPSVIDITKATFSGSKKYENSQLPVIDPSENGFHQVAEVYTITKATIFFEGGFLEFSPIDEAVTIGDNKTKGYTFPENIFIQRANKSETGDYLEPFRIVLQKYQNGKEVIVLRCDIREYFYDDTNEKAISPYDENVGKMSFDMGDEVIPYSFKSLGEQQPISFDKDGKPKVFSVKAIRHFYDGACWQEITLQEV